MVDHKPTTPVRDDGRDLGAGLACVAIGTGLAVYCRATYPIGTLHQPDTGAVPMWLGIVLAGLGAVMTWEGRGVLFGRMLPAAPKAFPVRAALVTLLAFGLFGLLIEHAGILPATVTMIVTADFAAGRPAPLRAALIGAVMAALGYAVFVLGLGIAMPTDLG